MKVNTVGLVLIAVAAVVLRCPRSTHQRPVDQCRLFLLLALGLNIVVGLAGILDLATWRSSRSGTQPS